MSKFGYTEKQLDCFVRGDWVRVKGWTLVKGTEFPGNNFFIMHYSNTAAMACCSNYFTRLTEVDKNFSKFKPIVSTRWLLKFEFQLPHPIISPALASDKKWPLCQFHISYQDSEISKPKEPISDFQSQLSMSKIIQNFLKKFHWRVCF